MPSTVHILAALSQDRRAELERLLATLKESGYTITVHPDGHGGELETGLGYRVVVDAPGYHGSTRVRVDATPADWRAALKALRPSPR